MARSKMELCAAGVVMVIGGLVYAVMSPDYHLARALFDEAHHPLRHELASAESTAEQAVIVHVALSDRGAGTPEERVAIDGLANRLKAAVSASGTGGFDGTECDRGVCLLLLYGPDADRVFSSIEPILRASVTPKVSEAFNRHGRSADLRAVVSSVVL